MNRLSLLVVLLGLCTGVRAQGPIAGFPMPKGQAALALSYAEDAFDRYFLPDDGVEERSITTRSYSFFAEVGLSDQNAVVVTLPYMQTNDNDYALQDASLWIKHMNLDQRGGRAAHRVFTALGLGFPVGNYPVGGEEAIGQRATVFQTRLTYQYQHDAGWFLSGQSGIDLQVAPESVASWPLLVRTGYGNRFFYLEGWLEFITALGRDASVTGAAAGTGSSWRRAGGTVYLPVTKWFGATLSGARVLSGTFIGDSSRWSVGTVFNLGR